MTAEEFLTLVQSDVRRQAEDEARLMARPRQPVNLVEARGRKHLTRAESDERHRREPTIADDSIECPAYIDDEDERLEFMSYVKAAHPFLAALNTRAVNRITKIYTNAGATQEALWGDLDDTITKEILGAFREIDATQNKLAAFAMRSGAQGPRDGGLKSPEELFG